MDGVIYGWPLKYLSWNGIFTVLRRLKFPLSFDLIVQKDNLLSICTWYQTVQMLPSHFKKICLYFHLSNFHFVQDTPEVAKFSFNFSCPGSSIHTLGRRQSVSQWLSYIYIYVYELIYAHWHIGDEGGLMAVGVMRGNGHPVLKIFVLSVFSFLLWYIFLVGLCKGSPSANQMLPASQFHKVFPTNGTASAGSLNFELNIKIKVYT